MRHAPGAARTMGLQHMGSSRSLHSVLGVVAVLAAAMLAISFPLAVALQGQARIATTLEVIANARVAAGAKLSEWPDSTVRWETRDASGRRVASGGAQIEPPMLEHVVAFPANPQGNATLTVSKSLWPLIHEIGLLALAGSAVGIAVGLAARRAGLRWLDRIHYEQRAQNLRFHTAIDNISQGLCFFDGQQRLIVCNRRYAAMYDLADDIIRPGTTLQAIVDARFEAGSFPPMGRTEYLAWRDTIAISNKPSDTEIALRNGKVFAIHHEPMPDGGWVATHEDISERKQATAQIERMAHHDALTGLPNRLCFRDRLHARIADATPDEVIAVLSIDLDGFKVVNDTLGHPVGDALLRLVAQRLDDCVRQEDLLARLGGDEFAIVQMGEKQPHAAKALADRLVRTMDRPFDVDGHRIVVGTSVGVALWPDDGLDSDQLLSRADLALYDAKGAGRGDFRFFRRELGEKANNRRSLEIDLRRAVALGQLELHFQPIVSLRPASARGRRPVASFEALLRWNHPERGLVMPDTFIGLAEETGLIESIGAWVLDEATTIAARWPAHIGVAVNLSPRQLKHGQLLDVVRNALLRSGLRPERLELEITESVLLVENSINVALLHELRALGIKISLDDFGIGYSSLSYLRSFPFEKIKIDRSFVCNLVDSSEAAAIVRAIATLGDSLGMIVTAEGVETEEQLQTLTRLNCHQAQGYLFGRPVPACDVAAMLGAGPPLALVG